MTVRIAFNGRLSDEPVVRVGFIGCGSHSFRNLYPAIQFVPAKLVATCDLDAERAKAFARQFGAEASYDDHRQMLAEANLDAVLICTGYDSRGRPLYPELVVDCLKASKHVWFEKPPAASCAEIERMQHAAAAAGRNAMVGLKKMFFPANEKARELMATREFGRPHLVTIQYPQYVPTTEEFQAYARGEPVGAVKWFLDHLCHPVALLIYLLGMPQMLYYERSDQGGGVATFTFADGPVAVVTLTAGASSNGGMERTMIVGEKGRHITVENNTRVTLHRKPPIGYGDAPTYYVGGPETANTVWEPEFSLGQLYNKGLFLLGYWGEINEFARSILERRPPAKGTLEQAWQATRIFEGFAEGAGRRVVL
jgi:predicted dehydrogenase